MTSKLKEARQNAGYSVEEVAEILKIRKQYIIDLEEEKFVDLPGQIYVDGYTRMYYEFLKIDFPEKSIIAVKKPNLPRKERNLNKKYIVLFSVCMIVVVVSIYSLLKLLPEKQLENNLIENTIDSNGNNEATID
jgi:cytoskeletal protein RodZ